MANILVRPSFGDIGPIAGWSAGDFILAAALGAVAYVFVPARWSSRKKQITAGAVGIGALLFARMTK